MPHLRCLIIFHLHPAAEAADFILPPPRGPRIMPLSHPDVAIGSSHIHPESLVENNHLLRR